MQPYEHILNSKQKTTLSRLGFLTATPLYMGGGTALALQLGHRTSEDFDLYNREKFDVESLKNLFLEKAPDTQVLSEHEDGTLQMKTGGVDVSVFYYPYPLIGQLVSFNPIKLASQEDIAASKIAAIVQRAKQRDFVDIYFLIIKMGLHKILECAFRKFPWYRESSGIVLKSLVYFSEADHDAEAGRIKVFDKSVTWQKVKEHIAREVHRLGEKDMV